MKTLQHLLQPLTIVQIKGQTDLAIERICIDSRKVVAGSVFIALTGVNSDGHQFIEKAIAAGAVAVVVENMPEEWSDGITYVQVKSTAEAAGRMAHLFYNEPSKSFQLVGVTGTNGKTTIATLLYKLFSSLGYNCGLVSTVQNHIGDTIVPSTHTTPDAIALNELLQQMAVAGCQYVFMEVSSHAVHQHRIAGLQFAGALFSNITHDHLDYHKTFDEYIRVKKAFFDHLSVGAFAITNADDKRGMVMLQNTLANKQTYALKNLADFKGKILDNGLAGLHMMINDKEVYFRLIGEFNAYNLLAVYGAAINLGITPEEALQSLSALSGAEGRFDYIVSEKDKVIGIVDYAHTPDALLNVLTTIRNLRKGGERIITVVGCGGDRDTTKRPIMADVAAENSDQVILTSDNPRTEDPTKILADMEAGLNTAGKRKALTISDRKEAIKTAVQLAKTDDIILVAGKGHEKYQDINGIKHPFDDKAILLDTFKLFNK